jgi:hypothetical protein
MTTSSVLGLWANGCTLEHHYYLMILDKVSERCGYYDHKHDYDADRYLNAFWGREKTLVSKVIYLVLQREFWGNYLIGGRAH